MEILRFQALILDDMFGELCKALISMRTHKLLLALCLTIFLLETGCLSTKDIGSAPETTSDEGKKSLNKRLAFINSQLGRLDSLECGPTYANHLSVGKIIGSNLESLQCFSKMEPIDSTYLEVITRIFLAQDFESNTDYVNLLPYVRSVQHSKFFSDCIELLQFDYSPSRESGHIVFYPVCEYINSQLIMPNVKYIDGRPPVVYFNEKPMRYLHDHKYVDHMNYYRQMKDLW